MPVDLEHRLLDLVSRAAVLLGSPNMERVLPGILEVAAETVAADAYAVWRLDRQHDTWRVASHAGVSDSFASTMISGYARGGAAAAVENLEPIVAEDVLADPRLATRREAYLAEGILSMLAIPLVLEDGLGGTIVFYFRRRRTFSPDEIDVARALGHLAAAALRTADLHQDQLRREHQALFLARAGATPPVRSITTTR